MIMSLPDWIKICVVIVVYIVIVEAFRLNILKKILNWLFLICFGAMAISAIGNGYLVDSGFSLLLFSIVLIDFLVDKNNKKRIEESKWVYTERLRSGGELKVTRTNWYIQYYFPGPDLRYNGTFFTIQGHDIQNYKYAWMRNFNRYTRLKNTMPPYASFSEEGELGMTINVGGYNDGVCLTSYHMAINTKSMMDKVLFDYDYAKTRAEEIIKNHKYPWKKE